MVFALEAPEVRGGLAEEPGGSGRINKAHRLMAQQAYASRAAVISPAATPLPETENRLVRVLRRWLGEERLLVGLDHLGQAFMLHAAPPFGLSARFAFTRTGGRFTTAALALALALQPPGDGLLGERPRDPGVTVPEPFGGAQRVLGDRAPVVGAALVS